MTYTLQAFDYSNGLPVGFLQDGVPDLVLTSDELDRLRAAANRFSIFGIAMASGQTDFPPWFIGPVRASLQRALYPGPDKAPVTVCQADPVEPEPLTTDDRTLCHKVLVLVEGYCKRGLRIIPETKEQ
jgi:hypothetical protein